MTLNPMIVKIKLSIVCRSSSADTKPQICVNFVTNEIALQQIVDFTVCESDCGTAQLFTSSLNKFHLVHNYLT